MEENDSKVVYMRVALTVSELETAKRMAEQSGMNVYELLEELIRTAISRHENRDKTVVRIEKKS